MYKDGEVYWRTAWGTISLRHFTDYYQAAEAVATCLSDSLWTVRWKEVNLMRSSRTIPTVASLRRRSCSNGQQRPYAVRTTLAVRFGMSKMRPF